MTKISRNASCPCGSGKKYKKCCLAKEEVGKVRRARLQRENFNGHSVAVYDRNGQLLWKEQIANGFYGAAEKWGISQRSN